MIFNLEFKIDHAILYTNSVKSSNRVIVWFVVYVDRKNIAKKIWIFSVVEVYRYIYVEREIEGERYC